MHGASSGSHLEMAQNKQRRGKRQSTRGQKGPQPRSNGRARNRGYPAIQQGVGSSVPRPFGSTSGGRGAFDATSTCHLPLPIATGPYTVARVTQVVTSNSELILFGTFRGSYNRLDVGGPLQPPLDIQKEGWAPYCAVAASAGATNSPSTESIFYKIAGLDQLGESATIVPSALTVQVMNPNALQTTNGILYCGRMKTQFRGEDSVDTWDTLSNEFISFQSPRLCSAGKLALRGVKIDAAPFNIKELQDFDRVVDPLDGGGLVSTKPWSSASEDDGLQAVNSRWKMKGFAPIAIANPGNVRLQYLVTMEFRCRFDLGHPASSTHVHHPPATEATWASHIKNMLSAGHGAMDIADAVAQSGQLFNRALPYGREALALMG